MVNDPRNKLPAEAIQIFQKPPAWINKKCHSIHDTGYIYLQICNGGFLYGKLLPWAPKTMKKYRFWPPKNQVIYHKKPLKNLDFGAHGRWMYLQVVPASWIPL